MGIHGSRLSSNSAVYFDEVKLRLQRLEIGRCCGSCPSSLDSCLCSSSQILLFPEFWFRTSCLRLFSHCIPDVKSLGGTTRMVGFHPEHQPDFSLQPFLFPTFLFLRLLFFL